MAHSYKKLRSKMTSESKEISKKLSEKLKIEMPFHELRYAREMTQEQLAKVLEQSQANISKIENRTDV